MSKNRKPRPKIERARAAVRLALDGELRPVGDLVEIAGASPKGIVRWIKEGRSGVYLDGIEDPLRGWCSTTAAVRRFLQEWASVAPSKGGAV